MGLYRGEERKDERLRDGWVRDQEGEQPWGVSVLERREGRAANVGDGRMEGGLAGAAPREGADLASLGRGPGRCERRLGSVIVHCARKQGAWIDHRLKVQGLFRVAGRKRGYVMHKEGCSG